MSERPLEDWEYPEPDEEEDDEESEQLPCPACGETIYEDADRCPYCGQYVTPGGTFPLFGRSALYVALALLGVIAVVTMLLRW